jgi:hypothetical protein
VLPAPSLPGPVPSMSQPPAGATRPGPTTPKPAAPGSSQGPAKTFDNGTSPGTQERLKPTPDSNTGPAPAKMPFLGAPQGRTAQRPIRQAVYVQPVSYTQAGSPVLPRLDTSGWEAAGN